MISRLKLLRRSFGDVLHTDAVEVFVDKLLYGVDLDDLRQALYIQDNPNYAKGAVRFDLDPTELKNLDIKLHKPTAFDGMMQGWGTDPWWVTKPGPWGITKNNTHEAVMESRQFRFFKHRTLMLPTAPPAAAGGAAGPARGAGAAAGGAPRS